MPAGSLCVVCAVGAPGRFRVGWIYSGDAVSHTRQCGITLYLLPTLVACIRP